MPFEKHPLICVRQNDSEKDTSDKSKRSMSCTDPFIIIDVELIQLDRRGTYVRQATCLR